MSDPVYPGQRVLVEVKFFLRGVPTDPTVAQFYVKTPNGSTTILTYPDPNFTRRDQGFFEASIDISTDGTWLFRGVAAGIVDAANEAQLIVSPSSF